MLLARSSDTLKITSSHNHPIGSAILSTVFLSALVHTAPLRDCSDQRPCYITAYKDADPQVGQVLDWFCRDHAYEGHRGTDFGIGGFEEMDRGRPVFATAQGVVAQVADGFEDRCTSGRCEGGGGLGNHVYIDHDDGTQSRFGHLRQGSIRVEVGEVVDCSTQLGQVGSSGYSTGPHLHFELREGGRAVEVFAGDCGAVSPRWRGQNNYRELPSGHCPAIGRDDSQVIDENLPDGSAVDVGVPVQKRWVLRNVGTSEWDDAVRAVRLSEVLWGAPDAVELSEVVAPGAHTTLAVTLEATEPVDGSIQIRYQLERQGIPFGAIFWAELVTASPDRDAGLRADGGTLDAGGGSVSPPPGSGCGCHQTHPGVIGWMAWLLMRRRRVTSLR